MRKSYIYTFLAKTRSYTSCYRNFNYGIIFVCLQIVDLTKTNLKVKFGRKLRQIRRFKNLTQEQLAEAIGVSVEFISNIERGINAPSFDTLEKLSEFLNVSYVDLFNFPDD